jgi:hypothetical protein
MKKCPLCNLINTDGTEICDCGYNFASGTRQFSIQKKKPKKPGFFDKAFTGNIYDALAFGALFGGIVSLRKGLPEALGGAIGGAILFGVLWRIVQFFRKP